MLSIDKYKLIFSAGGGVGSTILLVLGLLFLPWWIIGLVSAFIIPPCLFCLLWLLGNKMHDSQYKYTFRKVLIHPTGAYSVDFKKAKKEEPNEQKQTAISKSAEYFVTDDGERIEISRPTHRIPMIGKAEFTADYTTLGPNRSKTLENNLEIEKTKDEKTKENPSDNLLFETAKKNNGKTVKVQLGEKGENTIEILEKLKTQVEDVSRIEVELTHAASEMVANLSDEKTNLLEMLKGYMGMAGLMMGGTIIASALITIFL